LPLAGLEPTTLVVICTNCVVSYKFNYYTITTTTVLVTIVIPFFENVVFVRNNDRKMFYDYNNKADSHDIAEILLKGLLSTITLALNAVVTIIFLTYLLK
jgi:hypothetical protein